MVMRRAVDMLVCVVVGLVLVPVMLVVAGLVRWRLGSPVLFRQTRVGRAREGVSHREVPNDASRAHGPENRTPTATAPLGRRLRAVSLDELPQLWNVLAGDMSLIGPRPTLPEQVKHYSERQRHRLDIRPGLTGWAQVNGRNSISWPERIELDLHYIENRSVLLDARIIARTVKMLARPVGIYGAGGVNPGFPMPETATAPSTTAEATTTAGNSST